MNFFFVPKIKFCNQGNLFGACFESEEENSGASETTNKRKKIPTTEC